MATALNPEECLNASTNPCAIRNRDTPQVLNCKLPTPLTPLQSSVREISWGLVELQELLQGGLAGLGPDVSKRADI